MIPARLQELREQVPASYYWLYLMLLKVIVFSEISKLACPLQKGALPLQVMTMAWSL